MNYDKLNDDLFYLIELRNELHHLDFNADEYDDKEQEMQDAEDQFNDKYGKGLESILQRIHEEVAPGSEVLSPTAYLAKNYIASGEDEDGDPLFRVLSTDGIPVETRYDDENNNAVFGRLVILPKPLRFILTFQSKSVVIWSQENPEEYKS